MTLPVPVGVLLKVIVPAATFTVGGLRVAGGMSQAAAERGVRVITLRADIDVALAAEKGIRARFITQPVGKSLTRMKLPYSSVASNGTLPTSLSVRLMPRKSWACAFTTFQVAWPLSNTSSAVPKIKAPTWRKERYNVTTSIFLNWAFFGGWWKKLAGPYQGSKLDRKSVV